MMRKNDERKKTEIAQEGKSPSLTITQNTDKCTTSAEATPAVSIHRHHYHEMRDDDDDDDWERTEWRKKR